MVSVDWADSFYCVKINCLCMSSNYTNQSTSCLGNVRFSPLKPTFLFCSRKAEKCSPPDNTEDVVTSLGACTEPGPHRWHHIVLTGGGEGHFVLQILKSLELQSATWHTRTHAHMHARTHTAALPERIVSEAFTSMLGSDLCFLFVFLSNSCLLGSTKYHIRPWLKPEK